MSPPNSQPTATEATAANAEPKDPLAERVQDYVRDLEATPERGADGAGDQASLDDLPADSASAARRRRQRLDGLARRRNTSTAQQDGSLLLGNAEEVAAPPPSRSVVRLADEGESNAPDVSARVGGQVAAQPEGHDGPVPAVHAVQRAEPPRVIAVRAGPAMSARDSAFNTSAGNPDDHNRGAVTRLAGNSARSNPANESAAALRHLEAAVLREPNDFDAQLRLRLAYLAQGLDAQALTPTPGMTAENLELVLGMVRLAQAARSRGGRDSAEWAQQQFDSLAAYHATLRARADLRVPRVALCRSVQSFGVYEEIAPAEFDAGQQNTALAYVEAANFRTEPVAGQMHRSRFTARLAIIDRSGQEVWSRTEENIEDISRNIRQDFFVALEMTIPAALNPGDYTLKATMTDVAAGKTNEGRTTFRLRS